jgi:hypothetical protein
VVIRTVALFLYNEKTKVEAESIIKHGPHVAGELRHPFEEVGGVKVKRGVWIRPGLDKSSLQTI